ncbi:MAG: carboxylesterase, partial [Xanthomonadales bacterium]|nr:carboxylesterase [Xanthomonadales bacterium]
RQDEAGIRASMAQLEALIAREVERGIPSTRIFLAGFSQGAAMVLSGGLRHTQPLAGIIALSGYLPLEQQL